MGLNPVLLGVNFVSTLVFVAFARGLPTVALVWSAMVAESEAA